MTSPLLLADLRRFEGLRLKAYPDPLSPLAHELAKPLNRRVAGWAGLSGAPWTWAYGHTGPEVGPDTQGTLEQAEQLLATDAAEAEALCARHLTFWARLDPVRRDALANMMFQMGWDNPKTTRLEGLSGFTQSMPLIAAGRYAEAVDHMKLSAWHAQTPERAEAVCHMILTGARIGAVGPVLPPPPTAPQDISPTPGTSPFSTGWLGALTDLFNRITKRAA